MTRSYTICEMITKSKILIVEGPARIMHLIDIFLNSSRTTPTRPICVRVSGDCSAIWPKKGEEISPGLAFSTIFPSSITVDA